MEKKTVLFVNAINENHPDLSHLVEETIADLRSIEYDIWELNLYAHPISFCTDCKMCFREGGRACCKDENFNRFAELLLKADIVVFAAPVLWDTPPAILQALLDKLKVFLSSRAIFGGVRVEHKKWGFIGVTLEPREIIDSVKDNISCILDAFEWEFLGTIHGCKYEPDYSLIAEIERNTLIAAMIPIVNGTGEAERIDLQQRLLQKMAEWESAHKTRALID